MKLIVGLGNPGPQYAHNRHNVGYQIVEQFARKHRFASRKLHFNSVVTSGALGDEKVWLARPLTFMNESGRAVAPLVRWLKLDLRDLLVVYDEIDLPLGKLRLRPSGSSGGHNGMKSLIRHLGSEEFPRLRVGVGRPVHGDGANYLLSDFTRDDQPLIADAIERAVEATELFVSKDLVTAMNQFNAS